MKDRGERRKLDWKAIQHHLKRGTKGSRKGYFSSEKYEKQPHRLFSGPNWDNHGGFAWSNRQDSLPRDKRNEERHQSFLKDDNND